MINLIHYPGLALEGIFITAATNSDLAAAPNAVCEDISTKNIVVSRFNAIVAYVRLFFI